MPEPPMNRPKRPDRAAPEAVAPRCTPERRRRARAVRQQPRASVDVRTSGRADVPAESRELRKVGRRIIRPFDRSHAVIATATKQPAPSVRCRTAIVAPVSGRRHPFSGGRVAIVGAGPCGLACARELERARPFRLANLRGEHDGGGARVICPRRAGLYVGSRRTRRLQPLRRVRRPARRGDR